MTVEKINGKPCAARHGEELIGFALIQKKCEKMINFDFILH